MDLALLLSTTPESYSLTLDECRDAGVPVIAFDHGAIAERVHALEGGLLIPDETARVGDVARAHLRLYRELGVL